MSRIYLHDVAMALVDIADMYGREGGFYCPEEILERAFEIERMAAWEMYHSEIEPTRSVLYRSAATLGHQCKREKEALKLIDDGLAGNPPAEIKAELDELRAEVVAAMERYREAEQ